jgi:tetratricopeptide (TPR) repeat protein
MDLLQHNPCGKGNHALNAEPNKSPKEILNDIKQLYQERKFEEAHELCKGLVSRFPNNQDLKGLLQKIESRVQKEQVQRSGAWVKTANLEATQYYTERVEQEINRQEAAPRSLSELYQEEGSDDSMRDAGVSADALIQRGVMMYEAQDLAQALHCWRQALTLEPGNRAVQEYIQNVTRLMNEVPQPSMQAQSPARQAAQPPQAPVRPPDKEQLLSIYNEGLRLFKEKKYEEAQGKWEYILRFHPGHKETQECLKKTQVALEKEREYQTQLEEAEEDFRRGEVHEAERKVLHLLIKAPHLVAAGRLKEAIEDRKRQITEIRSMEIEQEHTHIAAATEEEITRFFTPSQEQRKTEAKPTARVIVATKKKKPLNLKLVIGVPAGLLLAIAGVWGYFFWKSRQLKLNQSDDPISILVAQDTAWNSAESLADTMLSFAHDFSDEGDTLFSMLSYQRATDLATPRLLELTKELGGGGDAALAEKVEKLRQTKTSADGGLARLNNRVTTKPVSQDELKNSMADLERGYLEKALPVLLGAFQEQTSNQELRQKLASCLEKLALKKVKAGELDEALSHFIKASVVNTWNPALSAHVEVINRFYNGKLSQSEKDQWFFFFLD